MRLSGSALIAAAALGPLLIGSAIYAHLVVRGVSDNVLRGEAEAWARTLATRFRDQGWPTAATLTSFLDESRGEGLRYVAFLGGRGRGEPGEAPAARSRIEAGTPAAAFDDTKLEVRSVTWVGRLVRFAVPAGPMGPPRPRGEFAGPGPARPGGFSPFARPPRRHWEQGRFPAISDPGGGPHERAPGPPGAIAPESPGLLSVPGGVLPPLPVPPRMGGGRFPGLPLLVLEFEPRASAELMRASNRTLAIGSVTAAVVVILCLWVWQSMRRQQAMEREAERARHLAALGEMSAVLAHEIRNPLASLKGHAQLLVEGLSAARQDKPLAKAERVVQEAVRLEGITTDLLDFVRQGELDRQPTNLVPLVKQAVEEIVPAERLKLGLPASPVQLSVDAPKLRQVIDNVVRNAVQAGDGPVEVNLEAGAGSAELSVRDHGPGIEPGQEERIFEAFVTTRVRGTGLGLAVARRIADRHGGSLTASNHAEGGAVFRLILPRD